MSDDAKRQPTALGDILARYEAKKDGKYISREFQDYGYRLAVDLDDLAHTSLYIRLAKTVPRAILESARGFVVDAPSVQNKARLFMWKMKELRAKG